MAAKGADIGEIFVEIFRFIMFTGFFYWLLVNGPDFAGKIIASLWGQSHDHAANRGDRDQVLAGFGNDRRPDSRYPVFGRNHGRHGFSLDLDSTIFSRHGAQQQGAARGYNPRRPGRLSHRGFCSSQASARQRVFVARSSSMIQIWK